MYISYATVLGITALVTIVHAQNDVLQRILTEAPSCALPCVSPIVGGGRCSLTNLVDCLCTNVQIQSDLSECVQTSCKFADQVTAVGIEKDLCEGYPQESRSQDVRLAAILCSAFLVPIIVLRLYARLSTMKKLGLDDYMTIVAFLAHLAVSGIEIASASMGFGKHYWHIEPEKGALLLQLFWVVQMLYIVIQIFTKLAILFLLARVFSTPTFQLVTKVFAAFLVANGIAFVFVDAFQCTPVYAVWDRYLEGNERKCINITAAGFALASVNILQDVALLLLPIPWVFRLQMNMRKKILVASLFSVGSFACITSFIRVKYLVKFSKTLDSTWDNVDVVIWSVIEGFSALLCGSLPAIWPLIAPYAGSWAKWASTRGTSTKKSMATDTTTTSYRLRHLSISKKFTELNDNDNDSEQELNDALQSSGTVGSEGESTDFRPEVKKGTNRVEIQATGGYNNNAHNDGHGISQNIAYIVSYDKNTDV